MSENAKPTYYEAYASFMESGFVGFVFSFSHVMMERRYRTRIFEEVLELGATNFNHVSYVRHQFKKYLVTDLHPYGNLKNDSVKLNSEKFSGRDISFELVNAEDLSSFSDNSFDRVIATCLILHLSNFRVALNEWRRVTKKKGGVITLYVHCEPGALLRFIRFFTTNLKNRRGNANHLSFVYSEHTTYFLAVKHAIKEVFVDDSISVRSFPFPFLSWNFNLWKIYHIKLKDSQE